MPNLDLGSTLLREAYEALRPENGQRIHVTTEDALGPIRERLLGVMGELENVTTQQQRVA
jgi:hypothetical protein